MAGLDYAALAVGEAELSGGLAELLARRDRDRLPYLAANLADAQGAHPLPATRTVKLPEGEVGLFAVTLLDAPLAGLHAEDPGAASQRAIAALRAKGVVAIVGLFHGPLAQVQPLLSGLELDAALVGHDGRGGKLLDHPPTYGAGQKGRELRVVELELGPGPIEDVSASQDARDEVASLDAMIHAVEKRDAQPATTDAGHATFGVQLARLRERRQAAQALVDAPRRSRAARLQELPLGPDVPEDAALARAVAAEIALDGHAPGH